MAKNGILGLKLAKNRVFEISLIRAKIDFFGDFSDC
jgi:hypothetical protein